MDTHGSYPSGVRFLNRALLYFMKTEEKCRKALELDEANPTRMNLDTCRCRCGDEVCDSTYDIRFKMPDAETYEFCRNHAPELARELLRTQEALRVAMDKLEELATNQLSEANCASVELAGKRVRNHATKALADIRALLDGKAVQS
jgi:hypothetical protein